MFAILRGANGRRHEVDFDEAPVIVEVSMSAATVQIAMMAADPSDPVKGRYVNVALPRDALAAAMAAAAAHPGPDGERGLHMEHLTPAKSATAPRQVYPRRFRLRRNLSPAVNCGQAIQTV